jgi:hypothetical protein
MEEAILVEFERNGGLVPVTSFRSTRAETYETGIVLDGETSCWPRGFALHLKPDAVTKVAVERVQQRLDWLNPRRFEIEAARDGTRLRLEGVDKDALPAGGYEVRMQISGLQLEPSSQDVRIREGAPKILHLREKQVKEKLLLNRPVGAFDRESARILQDSRSALDGLNAAEWLTTLKHRDRRKACLLNVFAKLAAIPKPSESLNRMVEHVCFAEMDRIYCAVSPDFHKVLKKSFTLDSAIHSTHERLLTRIPGVDPDAYQLKSYREKASSSLQVVIAVPKQSPSKAHYVDMDIDKGNPGWDLRSFSIHVGELLDPRQTNHLKLRKKLVRAGLSDFLYYDVDKTDKR